MNSSDIRVVDTTESPCPTCQRFIPAEIVTWDGKVFMRKLCPQHGDFQVLVHSDAEQYLEGRRERTEETGKLLFCNHPLWVGKGDYAVPDYAVADCAP